MNRVVYDAEKLYAPVRYVLPADWNSRRSFEDVLRFDLNFKSSPGIPLMFQYSTVAQAVGWDGMSLDPLKVELMWQLVSARLINRDWDPYRLFIKPEPHKIKKCSERRFRLIFAGGLVDQIIDHMLFGHQNKLEIKKHLEIPTKVGWAPFGGGTVLLTRMIRDPMAIDKSSWDWLAPQWVFLADLQLRERLCDGATAEWLDLVRARYKYAFEDAVVVASDGGVYKQRVPGLMKSGLVNTIATNSVSQVFLHLAASRRCGVVPKKLIAMGDDTLQEKESHPDYLRHLQDLGCEVKEVDYQYHFCGYDLQSEVPLYWDKHFFSLSYLNTDLAIETLRSYQRNWAMDDTGKLSWLRSLILEFDPEGNELSVRGLRDFFQYGE